MNLRSNDKVVGPYLGRHQVCPKIRVHFHQKVNILSNLLCLCILKRQENQHTCLSIISTVQCNVLKHGIIRRPSDNGILLPQISYWQKIVIVIERNFWNSRPSASNFQKFWDDQSNLFKQWKVGTIFGNRMFFWLVPEGFTDLTNQNN